MTEMERHLNDPAIRASLTADELARVSVQVSQALEHKTSAVREAALRMVILYGEALDLQRDSVFDLVQIFREHEDDRVRRMSIVAIGQTKDEWAIDFLRRSARFETNPQVRHTLVAVVAKHENRDADVRWPLTATN